MLDKNVRRRFLLRIKSYLEIFGTLSFFKLFLSLIFLVIIPFALFITYFLYKDYHTTLDWNYRFQLTRVQLMSIDLENHIRDQLLTQTKEKTHFWQGNLLELEENQIFNKCLDLGRKRDLFRNRVTYFFPCEYQSTPKNWILLFDSGTVWIYSAEFLEDLLLDSPFSEPYESIFLMNNDLRFGLSSQIENNFRVPEHWYLTLKSFPSGDQTLPKLRDVSVNQEDFFLSSFPLYGLPFQLNVVSPKELMLEPIRLKLIRNILFLSILFLITLILSAWISGREMEDKRKLNIIFREFPHAALLYDAEGKQLLGNPILESKISISSLTMNGSKVYDKIHIEAKSFLKQVSNGEVIYANTRIEEWDTINEEGDLVYLEIAFHLWFLENNQTTPRGTLVLIQDITQKKLEFEKEMVYAKNLQKKYLPSGRIEIPRIQYDVTYLPLLHVSGDYYDYLDLGNERYIFVLADIVGHGVQAAMMMTVVRVLFHQIVKETSDPAIILQKMNTGVRGNLPDSYSYVPLHFLLFDFSISKIFYGNAGHPGVVHIDKTGNTQISERLNPMLGILPSFKAKILEWDLCSGDRFFLFTDGLADVRNNRNKDLGYDELIHFFQNAKSMRISEIRESLTDMVKTHAQGASYPDDITWIGIEVS